MTRLPVCLIALPTVVCLAGGVAYTQSLAEVARKEEQRRQSVGKSSKVYTNKDLQPVRPGGSVTAGSTVTPAGEEDVSDGKEGDGRPAEPGGRHDSPQASPDDGPPKQYTEAQWRTRMAEAHVELERARMFAEALQSRINALAADFSARDDPAQRAAIETDRQRALAELARVKTDIEIKTKAIADIEEEARRAGVPPGWLR
jgi:hypothetical protein